MTRIDRKIDSVKQSLLEGNTESALKELEELESEMQNLADGVPKSSKEKLQHVLSLAKAAAAGLEDARGLLSSVLRQARNTQTYDGAGRPKAVASGRTPLGKF